MQKRQLVLLTTATVTVAVVHLWSTEAVKLTASGTVQLVARSTQPNRTRLSLLRFTRDNLPNI
jgi:hypothetical protein